MRLPVPIRPLAAALVLVLSTVTAWAQAAPYACTSTSGQWVAPPASATSITPSSWDDSNTSISTPFLINYWGTNYSTCYIGTNGHVCFTSTASATNYSPLTLGIASGATNDGIVCVAQRDLYGGNASKLLRYWSDGTAPYRRFCVAWTNWDVYANTNGTVNFQVQFYETSNRIVMAYTNVGSWTPSSVFGVGIDQPGGTGYVTPSGAALYQFSAQPPSDFEFAPPIINISGSVTWDRYVVSPSGIAAGGATQQNLPLAGIRIEQRDAAGTVLAGGYTDASGNFSFSGKKDATVTNGSIVVASGTAGCNVRTSAAAALRGVTIATGLSYANNVGLAPVQLNEAKDPGGVGRAPINAALAIQSEYDWARVRTTDVIPVIDAYYDPASVSASTYTPKGAAAATMTVGANSSNPDGWDNDVVRKVYARHVLAAIATASASPFDATFDKATDDQNAFAEGFGYYMAAVLSGSSTYTDGLGATSATVINLEDAKPATAKGSNVAAWVAMALCDLVDPANESWDTVDGTSPATASDYAFRTVDTMTTASPAGFVAAWVVKGYGGVGVTRDFIYHGLLRDDADELNDSASEAKVVSQFGFVRKNLVLTQFNEDWFEFTMPQPTNKLIAQVVYDRFAYSTSTVLLEIRNAAGTVLAIGAPQGTVGPVQAQTGALPAGTYRARVTATTGGTIATYNVQVFSELAFSSPDFPAWTVNQRYNVPVNVKGGVPPYILSVELPFVKPSGIILDGVNARVNGTPAEIGLFNFILSAKDSASPNNIASGPVSFRVNPELGWNFGDFVAFALGKPVDRKAAYAGGTAPFTATVGNGAMPAGVGFTPGTLRFTGTPTVPGSYFFELTGVDVAGSTATTEVTGVVCVPMGAAPLGAGSSAAGFYFDAVKGSVVNLAFRTSAGQPKRPLHPVLLDRDGATELPARAKSGNGKASVAGFVVPETGRYFCVTASTGAGDPSEVTATATIAAGTKGSGKSWDTPFSAGQTFPVSFGALAGSTLTFKATPDRSGLELTALYLYDPNGTVVPLLASDVTYVGGAFTVVKDLGVSGTWRMYIGAKPGKQGQFKYAFTVDEPADVTFDADGTH